MPAYPTVVPVEEQAAFRTQQAQEFVKSLGDPVAQHVARVQADAAAKQQEDAARLQQARDFTASLGDPVAAFQAKQAQAQPNQPQAPAAPAADTGAASVPSGDGVPPSPSPAPDSSSDPSLDQARAFTASLGDPVANFQASQAKQQPTMDTTTSPATTTQPADPLAQARDFTASLGDPVAAFQASQAKQQNGTQGAPQTPTGANTVPTTPNTSAVPAALTGASAAPPSNTPVVPSSAQPSGNPLAAQARQIATANGLDPDVFDRLVQNESSYNPNARSGVGAIGLTQLMPQTAAGLGVDPTDPTQNLQGGAKYLKQMLDYYKGDYSKAIAAYNTGPGNVDRGNIPTETTAYVARVLGGGPAQATTNAPMEPAGNGSAAPVVSPGRDLTPDQFERGSTTKSLTDDEAMSACGPALAVAFARANGRNPTLREAMTLAEQSGWTSSGGMNGLANEKALLDKMGVPYQAATGVDWGKVGAAAQNGQTVGISTPVHYFVVTDYNPKTGQYFVGQSGLAFAKGSQWMTADQITALGKGTGDTLYTGGGTSGSTSTTASAGSGTDVLGPATLGIVAGRTANTQPSYRAPFSDQQQPVQSTVTRPPNIAPGIDKSAPLTTPGVNATADASASPVDRALASFGQAGPAVGRSAANIAQAVAPIASTAADVITAPYTATGGRAATIASAAIQNPSSAPGVAFQQITDALTQSGIPADLIQALQTPDENTLNLLVRTINPGVNAAFLARDIAAGNGPQQRLVDAWNQTDPTLPPTQRIQQALATASAPFKAGGVQAATDPTGGILAGLDSFIRGTATDPRMAIGAEAMPFKAMAGGAAALGIGAGVASRLAGATPEQTASNTATGAGIGTMAGPVAESLAPLAGRAAELGAQGLRTLGEVGTEAGIVPGLSIRPVTPIDPTDFLQADSRWTRLQILAQQARFPLDFHSEMLNEELADIPHAPGTPEYQAAAAPLISSYTRGVYQDIARDVGQRFTSTQAQLAGLQATLDPDMVAIAKMVRPVTEDLTTMSADNFTRLTGITPSESSIVVVDGKRYVDPNYTFDELAQSHGYSGSADFQRAIEQTKQQVGQVAALKQQLGDLRGVNNGLKEFGASYAGNGAAPAASVPSTVDLSNVDRTPGIGVPRELGVPGPTPASGAAGAPVNGAQAALIPPTPKPVPVAVPGATQKLLDMFAADAKPPPASVGDTLATARNNFVRAWTDNKVDLANFQNQAQRAVGRPLNADEMMYELSRLNPDMGAQIRIQNGLQPAIQSVGKDLDQLSAYLAHQSNIDVAAALDNPSRPFSGGITASDSALALQDMPAQIGQQRFSAIQSAADQVVKFNQELLQRKVDSGLIPQQLATDLTAQYPHYVPARIVDYMDNPMNVGRGQPISVSDTGLKRLTEEGTTKAREDPLASTVRNAYQTEALIRRNDAFNAFTQLRNLDPQLQDVARIVSDDATIPASQRVPLDYKPTADEALVHGFVKGVRQDYVVPKQLGLLLDMAQKSQGPIMETVTKAMGVVRAVLASRNPYFVPTHALITLVPYLMREATRAGGPQELPSLIKALVEGYADAFQGFEKGQYGGTATQRYLLGGGGQFGAFDPSLAGAQKTVESLARPSPFTIQSTADIKRITADLLLGRGVGEMINRVDLAPRVASMRLAEGRGENPVQTIIRGKTSTIDFQQAGDFARDLNQFIPFMNVAMQGAAQPIRMVRDNPAAAFKSAIALLVVPTVGAEKWNRLDPQRSKDYDDVPRYVKDGHIIMMAPWPAPIDAQGNRKPDYLQIPMREFSPFVNITREIAGRAMGAEPSSWQDLATGIATGTFPIPLDSAGAGLARLAPLGPLATVPIGEVQNKDLGTGAPVQSNPADARASALAQTAAQGFNTATGATGQKSTQLAPSQVDYAVRNLGGGPGQLAQSASNLIAGRPNTATGTPQGLPIIGPLVKTVLGDATGQRLQDAKQQPVSDSTAQLLAKNGVNINITPVSNQIRGVTLTQAEQERYQVLATQYIDRNVRAMLKNPDWIKDDPVGRDKAMANTVSAARREAEADVIGQMGGGFGARRTTAVQATATAAAGGR